MHYTRLTVSWMFHASKFRFYPEGNNLNNFIVVVSDLEPPVSYGGNLLYKTYRKCGQYPGTPEAIPTHMQCDPSAIGRYLYLVWPVFRRHLHLCELQAFGERKDPDSKVHGAIVGPIWGRQDPGGTNVRPMNFAICGILYISIPNNYIFTFEYITRRV